MIAKQQNWEHLVCKRSAQSLLSVFTGRECYLTNAILTVKAHLPYAHLLPYLPASVRLYCHTMLRMGSCTFGVDAQGSQDEAYPIACKPLPESIPEVSP